MLAKARPLLRTPAPVDLDALAPGAPAGRSARRGLLLLVDTFSVDRKAREWKDQHYLKQWVEAVESMGFVFLRHQVLPRSHALAFATTHLTEAELAELALRAPPEMRMRREETGEPWK